MVRSERPARSLRQTLSPSRSQPGGQRDPGVLSPLDRYDVGRAHLRAGRFQEASLEFERVVDTRPQDFWPNFYQGVCAYRLGRFREADAAFRTCIALSPHSAECHYNRARVAEALGRTDRAAREYDRALELDPRLTAASINRGILACKNDRAETAVASFKQALSVGVRHEDRRNDSLQSDAGLPGAGRARTPHWPPPTKRSVAGTKQPEPGVTGSARAVMATP